MKITIENTTKIVMLSIRGHDVPARVWQGETSTGIPVQCFITRIAPEVAESHLKIEELTAEFARELNLCATPRRTVEAIPLYMFLD